MIVVVEQCDKTDTAYENVCRAADVMCASLSAPLYYFAYPKLFSPKASIQSLMLMVEG